MSMPRSLIIAAALTALLATTLAVPVAAAKTKLAIVNGIPGKKVDVCVNGREVKSGLRYGKFVFKNTRTAKATVKFYKRDPRRCGGKLLAKKTSGLDDATWVITRRHPDKIVLFDNVFLTELVDPSRLNLSIRHAADLGLVDIERQAEYYDTLPISPSAPFQKGDRWNIHYGYDEPGFLGVVFYPAGNTTTPLKTWVGDVVPPVRWEVILVGTSPFTARVVHISRPLTSP